jgi:hypothetical protein
MLQEKILLKWNYLFKFLLYSEGVIPVDFLNDELKEDFE